MLIATYPPNATLAHPLLIWLQAWKAAKLMTVYGFSYDDVKDYSDEQGSAALNSCAAMADTQDAAGEAPAAEAAGAKGKSGRRNNS